MSRPSSQSSKRVTACGWRTAADLLIASRLIEPDTSPWRATFFVSIAAGLAVGRGGASEGMRYHRNRPNS
jgi:hypothetical protein